MNRHSRAGGVAAYSEMLPQSAAVAFVLAEVAVNGAVMERDPVVFAQVGAYLFGTEFAADKGVDVLNQLRIELIGFSLTLFGQPALPLGFIGAVLLSLVAMPLDFAADGAFVAVKLFGDFGDGAVAGQVLDMVSFVLGQLCVAHGNLSCRKGRMLPHTDLFLLWKVALQMRIRLRLGSVVCSSWQSFLQERPYATAYWPFLLWKVALQMRIRRRLKTQKPGFQTTFVIVD